MFKQTRPPWKPVVLLGLGCLSCDLSSQRVTLLIGESLLTSLFTFFLISIRLDSQKLWPYI